MFKSYEFSDDNFLIIDSDFQESVNFNNKYWVEYIIEVYSRRNFNVAYNLFLYMQYQETQFGDGYSIEKQISVYKKHIKDFDKYLPEIKKYLALI